MRARTVSFLKLVAAIAEYSDGGGESDNARGELDVDLPAQPISAEIGG